MSSMESANARVQDSVNKLANNLDQSYLRKLQATMYRCMAGCCDNEHYNMSDTQQCLDRCSTPAQKAQQYMQQEMENWQNRLQRCTMDCQDKVRDKIGTNTSEGDVAKYRGQFESCALKCVDSHLDLLPGMEKKMGNVLKDFLTK